MGIVAGTVVAGEVVIEGFELPEGSRVTVLTPEPTGEVQLTPEARFLATMFVTSDRWVGPV